MFSLSRLRLWIVGVCMCAFDLIKPTTEKLPIMFHSFKDKKWTMRNHHIWESAQLERHAFSIHKFFTLNAQSCMRLITPSLSSLTNGNYKRVPKIYIHRRFGDGKLSNNQSYSRCYVYWKKGEFRIANNLYRDKIPNIML